MRIAAVAAAGSPATTVALGWSVTAATLMEGVGDGDELVLSQGAAHRVDHALLLPDDTAPNAGGVGDREPLDTLNLHLVRDRLVDRHGHGQRRARISDRANRVRE